MKKLYIYILLILPLVAFSQDGGVGVGTNGSVKSSAILDIGNTDNKGVLFPQVELLDDLSDLNYPIANPIDGMIIYNIGNAQFHGYYYWDANQWKLMGDSFNVVTDSVYRITTPITSFLSGKSIGSYQYLDSGWTEFSNNITGFSGTSAGVFTVPEGSYLVHVNANISVPLASSTAGVIPGLHLMKLRARLSDGVSTVFGRTTGDNGILRSGVRAYSTNFDFSFTANSTKTMLLSLTMDAGGTYSNGVGGTSPNDGSITISDITIHFQRIIATP